ncbi:MAG: hypothetical protein KA715_05200 [Xanthomonadaceae bacterium]|nr:hypothetical protein [Xanthomonadaceae bacterium]
MKNLLVWTLISALWLNPLTSSLAWAQDTESTDDLSRIENVILKDPKLASLVTRLENASETALPPRSTDAWNITNQFLIDGKHNRTYSLSELQAALPTYAFSEFEKEFQPTIGPKGELRLNLIRKGETIATHEIKGIDALSVSFDKELMIIIKNDERILAADMVYAREALFNSPIPFFDMGRVPARYLSKNLNIQFISKDLKPFTSEEIASDAIVPENKIWNAGDVAIETEFPQRKLFQVLDRETIKMQIGTAQATLSVLLAPYLPAESQAILNAGDVPVQEQDSLTDQALQAIGSQQLKILQSLAFRNSSPNEKLRDQFTFDEWMNEFKTQKNLVPEVKKVSPWKKTFKADRMKKLALAVGGVFGLGAVVYTGHDHAWANHIINEVYNNYWPDVLKDQVYRITLLKSTLWLSSFVPILYAAGTLIGKTKGWSFKKTLATYGIKAYAELSRPFFHHIADLTRQPLFLKTLQLGVSPFKNSVGFINPLLSKQDHKKEKDQKAAEIAARLDQKKRLTSIAWLMAHTVVSSKTGIDPVTLSVAETHPESLKNKEEFNRRWEDTSAELMAVYQQLMDTGSLNADLKSLSKKDIVEFYKVAQSTAEKINSRSSSEQAKKHFKHKWDATISKSIQNISNFGVSEYTYLKTIEPNHFVTEIFWQQFLVDYLLTVDQMALFGDRADLTKPDALAAREGSAFSTNPGHLVDTIDQVVAYNMTVPAMLAMVYQKQPDVSDIKTAAQLHEINQKLTDPKYNPREYITQTPKPIARSYISGIKSWISNSLNIPKADYGSLYLRSIIKKTKTIQAKLIMTLFVGRVLIAGQDIDQAFYGFIYYFIWSNWSYAWIWEPVNRGIQMDMDDISELTQKLQRATTLISQGGRLNEEDRWKEGYKELQSLFDLSISKAPKELREALREIEDHLNLPQSERISKTHDVKKYYGYLARLKLAMEKNDSSEITNAYNDLIATYKNGGVSTEELEKLNAHALMTYALKNPPVFTTENKSVTWTSTLIGALTTTYFATFLMVDSFDESSSWGEKITRVSILSTALYAGTFYGQKLINHLATKWEALKKTICSEKLTGT